ncbi:MAG TPA: phage terminase small subunit P27 family [Guyparkeria sp.]|nr:phage terminase small subunit P27 family [Guyparkeria sp.]
MKGNPSKLPAEALQDGICPDVKIPPCPAHLSAEAKREWKRISKHLLNLGIIAEIDMAALAMYCQAYGRWQQAEEKLAELGREGMVDHTPNGFKQSSTWLTISSKAAEQMRKLLPEFGMTPSARARLSAPSTDKPNGKKKTDRFF